MQNKKLVPLFSLLIFLLAGCGGMKLKRLNHVPKREANYCKEKKGVEVCIKKLSKKECPTVSLVPLCITISNNSSYTVILNDADFDFALADNDWVYDRLSKGPGGRFMTGFLIASGSSLLMEVSMVASACGHIVSYASGIFSFGVIGGIVGGIVGAIRAIDYNAQFRSYLERNMLKTLNVHAGDVKTRLIFVRKKHFHSPFELTLTQLVKENGTVERLPIIFDVKI